MGEATNGHRRGAAVQASEQHSEEQRGHGGWSRGQTGEGIGYEVILAAGMDNE